MPLLTVNNVKKIYTTRFGGNHIQALSKNISHSGKVSNDFSLFGRF